MKNSNGYKGETRRKTKLIALDVYGTFLRGEDAENQSKPRMGFGEFVSRCKEGNLPIVTASDSDLVNLKIDLEETLKKIGLDLSIFDEFYRLQYYPKDFQQILDDYGLNPSELFVIGDQHDKDIIGAKRLGCSTLQVPEYDKFPHDFDFSEVVIP